VLCETVRSLESHCPFVGCAGGWTSSFVTAAYNPSHRCPIQFQPRWQILHLFSWCAISHPFCVPLKLMPCIPSIPWSLTTYVIAAIPAQQVHSIGTVQFGFLTQMGTKSLDIHPIHTPVKMKGRVVPQNVLRYFSIRSSFVKVSQVDSCPNARYLP